MADTKEIKIESPKPIKIGDSRGETATNPPVPKK